MDRKKIWKGNLHAHLKMFMWRALQGVLPMRVIIACRTRAGERNCVVYRAKEETLFHLFKECPGARALAFTSK